MDRRHFFKIISAPSAALGACGGKGGKALSWSPNMKSYPARSSGIPRFAPGAARGAPRWCASWRAFEPSSATANSFASASPRRPVKRTGPRRGASWHTISCHYALHRGAGCPGPRSLLYRRSPGRAQSRRDGRRMEGLAGLRSLSRLLHARRGRGFPGRLGLAGMARGAHDAIGAEQRYIEPVSPRRHFLSGRSTLTFRLISLVKTFSGYDRS
jgi:hypothetical protein